MAVKGGHKNDASDLVFAKVINTEGPTEGIGSEDEEEDMDGEESN